MSSIHPTATIDEGAQIGEGSRIWHFSHVRESAVIGRNCVIGEHVYIGPNVIIGDGVKIQNNVSVYEGVTVEDDVFIGPSVVFTNVINPRAFIERKNEFRPTRIRKGATLGANSTLICGITVGEYAMVGAGAVVSRDVPGHALVHGVPSIHNGWVSRTGNKLPMPPGNTGEVRCPASGQVYIVSGYACRLKEED